VTIPLLLLMIGLLLLSAYASASEAAIFSLSRLQVHQLELRRDRGARRVVRLLRDPEGTLSTLLVTANLSAIGLSSAVTAFFLAVLSDPDHAVEVAFLSGTLALLLVGEITPKTLAVNFPVRVAELVSGGLLLLRAALRPATAGLQGLAAGVLRLLGTPVRGAAVGAAISRAELRTVLEEVDAESSDMTPGETRLVQNILDFPHRTAEDIMTPRVDIVDLDVALAPEEAVRRMRGTRHSRYPVYAGEPDNLIGFVAAKEFLLDPGSGLRPRLRPLAVYPEAAPVDRIFQEIQRSRTPMAMVVDEYGELAGLITREDVVEEIVGDIYDEFDLAEAPIRRKGEGLYLLRGRLPLADLNEELALELPAASAVTLNGFLCQVHGRIPRPGAIVEWEGLRFHVLEVARHQVRKVLLELPERRPEASS
jgi:putative hemolysin